MNFGEHGPEKVITRANLKASLLAYEEVRGYITFMERKLKQGVGLAHEREREVSRSSIDDVEGYGGFRRCNGHMRRIERTDVRSWNTTSSCFGLAPSYRKSLASLGA
jgi:hypothetical protein